MVFGGLKTNFGDKKRRSSILFSFFKANVGHNKVKPQTQENLNTVHVGETN